jgi:hypothetical protein
VLTVEQSQRLSRAGRLTDSSREGIGRACEVLQLEIEQVIGTLPGPLAAPLLVSLLVAGALVAGATVAYLHLASGQVELTIRNDGCAPIPLGQTVAPGGESFLDLVGIDLPQRIPTDSQATARSPQLPLTIGIDAAADSAIVLTVQGLAAPLTTHHQADQLELDGVSILGQHAVLNLRQKGRHELVVTCR